MNSMMVITVAALRETHSKGISEVQNHDILSLDVHPDVGAGCLNLFLVYIIIYLYYPFLVYLCQHDSFDGCPVSVCNSRLMIIDAGQLI